MAHVLRSGGMSEDDIRAWKGALDASASADELKAVIGRGIELVNARLADLAARYRRAKAPPGAALAQIEGHAGGLAGDGPRPQPARNSATTDPVCSLPKPNPGLPGFGHSLLVAASGQARSRLGGGGPSGAHRAERNTAFAAARNERNRPFRDGHHIGQRNSAVYCCRSDGFEPPHVRSSQPLNEGNSDTQDQFACRCRRIDHGRRDWKPWGIWGRATVSGNDQITTWLDGIGLAQYATVFAENAIDLDILPDVTEADLERLGVALGHRKRILRAIAALSGATRLPPRRPRRALPQSEAERRQLTVLFCDLVGSTALAVKLDPEDLRDVIRGFQGSCAAVITQMGGYVARFMGDGLLVYFGYPQAHEDDAERAVRAGLDLVAKVSQLLLPTGEPLQVRVGIATGLVVVGDTVGEELAQEQVVVGETPNLAARLQSVAAPNTTVIAASTLRLLGDVFVCEQSGAVRTQGIFRAGDGVAGLGGTSGREPFRRDPFEEAYAVCRPAE